MPNSANAAGLADHVLPVEQMPEALAEYVQRFNVHGGGVVAGFDETPDHLNQLLALLRARTKFDFGGYRKKMLARRLERRMGLSRFENVAEYLAHLREYPDEVKQLARDLLISVTRFFRDPDAFRALETEIVAPLIRAKGADTPLRLWVPGCATGEEPYSIAMLLLEHQMAMQNPCRLQIFATDVDGQSLEVARRGIYPDDISADVSPERLARFFTRVNESAYQISKPVRETVTFAVQNLTTDAPFFEDGPDQLPQHLDLPRTRGAEGGPQPLALRSRGRRLPVFGPVGDDRPTNRPVRASLQEMADLPAHWTRSGERLAVPSDADGATPRRSLGPAGLRLLSS